MKSLFLILTGVLLSSAVWFYASSPSPEGSIDALEDQALEATSLSGLQQAVFQPDSPVTHLEITSKPSRSVIINREPIDEPVLVAIEQQLGIRMVDGRYWYDAVAGLWGHEGGPTMGLAIPNLQLGGPLRSDASNGNTGVYINGRELDSMDFLRLQQLLGAVYPGRYWLNAQGYAGYEGGPALVNLRQLAAQSGGGGPWSHHSSNTGAHVGGDGNGFYYFIDGDVSWTSN